jgi:hypothetical protein
MPFDSPTPREKRLLVAQTTRVTLSLVCVDCLFLRSPSRSPYGTPPACAKRAAYPDPPLSPPPRIPRLPGVLPIQAQHFPQVGSGPNCFQALGSAPGLLQSPGGNLMTTSTLARDPPHVCASGPCG